MPNIQAFFAGIDLSLIIASILGGLAWGRLYNRTLNLPTGLIYHKFLTGAGYLIIILLSRLVTGGAIGPWERWVGFIVLWGIFCLSIRIGMGKILPRSRRDMMKEIEQLERVKELNYQQIHELERQGGDLADKENDVLHDVSGTIRDS